MANPIRNNLVIELHVPDFNVAKDFYFKLGFNEITLDHPVAEEPGYLVLKRKDPHGDTILNFYGGDERVYNQSYFKQFPKETKRGYEIEITVPVKEIDTFFENTQKVLKENIVQDLIPKRDREVTWRDFRMVDPFGFYLRFTELLDWGQ